MSVSRICKLGRDVFSIYEIAAGDAILNACSDEDSEAVLLTRVALIIRKQLFSIDHTYDGFLRTDPIENTVRNNLLALVNMIINGPSIESKTRRKVINAGSANHFRANCI